MSRQVEKWVKILEEEAGEYTRRGRSTHTSTAAADLHEAADAMRAGASVLRMLDADPKVDVEAMAYGLHP